MMIKDVTIFHKCYLGGWGMLECVCVCGVLFRILNFQRGGGEKVQSSMLTWRGCIAHNN